ncbi:MAG: hypothetical protein ACYC36_00235 [Bellilinea sp.]
MTVPKPITWLTEILRILRLAGVRVQFIRLYRDGQDEVGIILGGVRWGDIFTEEMRQ